MFRKNNPYWPPFDHYMDGSPNAMNNYNYYPPSHPTPFELYAKPKQPMPQDPYAMNHYTSGSMPTQGNLLQYFKDDNGELDYGKMLSTAQQAAKTAQQLSPVVKEVHSIIKQMNSGARY
ncbi:YppG family protein [Lentibacillus cibarius]|uniref:YppG-like protein n=1 Tax=Lentibacillus cibarius TaxID=2583219 RepID=A0A5S3QL18_9BACI|nr:YppG family protein [Lentibacillus cibarius]TMN22555.1 hypothetical protein FFL34_10865 [Lentibacillus cibarius]